jgi:hypothetical protein
VLRIVDESDQPFGCEFIRQPLHSLAARHLMRAAENVSLSR